MIDSGFQDVLGQARKMLDDSPFAEIRSLRVEQDGELVLLRGRVGTFFMKQLAQETVRIATRGVEVQNNVLVNQ